MWRRSGDSLFSGQVPCRIIIRLIDTEAFSWKIPTNSFSSQHYDLNFLCSHRQTTLPKPPSHSRQRRISRSLQDSLCRDSCIYRTIDIKRQELAHGYSMYFLGFIPGEPDALSFDLVQNGSVRLELNFKGLYHLPPPQSYLPNSSALSKLTGNETSLWTIDSYNVHPIYA